MEFGDYTVKLEDKVSGVCNGATERIVTVDECKAAVIAIQGPGKVMHGPQSYGGTWPHGCFVRRGGNLDQTTRHVIFFNEGHPPPGLQRGGSHRICKRGAAPNTTTVTTTTTTSTTTTLTTTTFSPPTFKPPYELAVSLGDAVTGACPVGCVIPPPNLVHERAHAVRVCCVPREQPAVRRWFGSCKWVRGNLRARV